jgi:predicted HTH domain antitoxin
MSLGKAAQFSGLSMSAFIKYLADLGIEIARPDETTPHETQNLSGWLS